MHWRCALHKFRYPVCNKRSNVHFRQPSWRRSRNNSILCNCLTGIVRRTKSNMNPHCPSQSNSRCYFGTALRCHISACICCCRAQNPPRTLCNVHPTSYPTRLWLPPRTVCSSACCRPIEIIRSTLRRHTSYPGSNPSPSCSSRLEFSRWSKSRCLMCKWYSPQPPLCRCSNSILCNCLTGIVRRTKSNMNPHCPSQSNSRCYFGTALRCHISACICCCRAQNPPRTLCNVHPTSYPTRLWLPPRTVCSSACCRPIEIIRSTLRRHTSYPGSNPSPSCSSRPDFATALVSRGAQGPGR